jgi:hypothetical protein
MPPWRELRAVSVVLVCAAPAEREMGPASVAAAIVLLVQGVGAAATVVASGQHQSSCSLRCD